jgi:hypothetical protein
LRALLGVIVDIILLRRGPEHVPASPALLAVVIAVYAAGAAITGAVFSPPDQPWAFQVVVAIVVLLAFYQVALTVAKKRERFVQTMTAMFAVRALYTPILGPLGGSFMASIQAKQPVSSMLLLLILAGTVWAFVIDVRIMRSAFEWPTPAAVLLVIGQQIVLVAVAVLILGGPQPTPA